MPTKKEMEAYRKVLAEKQRIYRKRPGAKEYARKYQRRRDELNRIALKEYRKNHPEKFKVKKSI